MDASVFREKRIRFTAREQAELAPLANPSAPLADGEIEGHTIVSLVSAGTEVVGGYSGAHHEIDDSSYPKSTGYASVFRVEAVGKSVEGIEPDDAVLAPAPHRSFQRVPAWAAAKVPDGLTPEKAVMARMAKICMPTYLHTRIRPPEKLVVTGLGMVGLMAAQVGQAYGYDTIACEPKEDRRRIAAAHGILSVLPQVPADDPALCKQIGLGLECSGHEQATLDLCNIVRRRGEVYLIGVPWVPRTEVQAHSLLHSVFYNYVGLHSGWEGEKPQYPEIHGEPALLQAALDMLADGRIRVEESVYRKVAPVDCQEAYQDILHARLDTLTVMFDWSR
jgi:threonine dehydrogenase-like Zn-dependent dehydrogenase